MKKAALILEDGKVFYGNSFGGSQESVGEVVFNTGMTGYQEILTDPSYAGQIVTMTYPLIGNYGVNEEDIESANVSVKGLIVKEFSKSCGSFRQTDTLVDYLINNNIPGICSIDTRALTKYIRGKGAMKGIITKDFSDIPSLIEKAKSMDYENECSSYNVGTKTAYRIEGKGPKVCVLDFGIKKNILRSLSYIGCDITVLPASSTLFEILSTNCDGVLLSNGPGDPKSLNSIIPMIKELITLKPVFGICLGHQILGLSLGGDTYKLPFGHRGGNHPVLDIKTGKVYITSQNHGFALDINSIDSDEIEVTHINLNDNTVEGIMHKSYPVFSVQYHPEACPGPKDSDYLFSQFLSLMDKKKIA